MYDWTDYILPAILIGLVLFCVFAVVVAGSHREKMIKQCLADGHKQYECETWVQ